MSILVTTLKAIKRDGDLSNEFLYQELISKLPRSLRMEWNRSMDKKEHEESVIALRKWCQQEELIRRKTDEVDERGLSKFTK